MRVILSAPRIVPPFHRRRLFYHSAVSVSPSFHEETKNPIMFSGAAPKVQQVLRSILFEFDVPLTGLVIK